MKCCFHHDNQFLQRRKPFRDRKSSRYTGRKLQASKKASNIASDPPQTQEEVIASAAICLEQQLSVLQKQKKSKAFGKGSQERQNLAVELSWADTSPRTVVDLVKGLLKQIDTDISSEISIGFWDVEAALIASDLLSNNVIAVDSGEDRDKSNRVYSKILLLVGVPFGQEEMALNGLNWRGSCLVILSLDTDSLSPNFPQYRRLFKTVFAFEAFALKGWLRTTEGLAVKQLREGYPGTWQLFKRAGSGFKLIGKFSDRPTSSNVELAFYNSSATESPVIRGIGAIRSVIGGKK